MKCRGCDKKATTIWGWKTSDGELVKAALCPACRRGTAKTGLVSLGKAK